MAKSFPSSISPQLTLETIENDTEGRKQATLVFCCLPILNTLPTQIGQCLEVLFSCGMNNQLALSQNVYLSLLLCDYFFGIPTSHSRHLLKSQHTVIQWRLALGICCSTYCMWEKKIIFPSPREVASSLSSNFQRWQEATGSLRQMSLGMISWKNFSSFMEIFFFWIDLQLQFSPGLRLIHFILICNIIEINRPRANKLCPHLLSCSITNTFF